jgi:hypothetical protein
MAKVYKPAETDALLFRRVCEGRQGRSVEGRLALSQRTVALLVYHTN